VNGVSRAAVGVWTCIGVVVVLIGLGVASWQLNWFVAAKDANRSVQVQHNGINYQSTLHDQIAEKYGEVLSEQTQIQAHPDEAANLKAQAANTAGTVCSDMSQISSSDPLDGSQMSWYRQNCDGADLSTRSTYYVSGGM
jgi:hypothetical protein